MTVESAIRAYLASAAGVTALVSTRIYQLILPEHPTFPAVRIQHIDEVEDQQLTQPVGLYTARLQVDVFGLDSVTNAYAAVTDIGEAIHTAFAATLDADIGGSPATVRVSGIMLEDRGVTYESDERRLIRERRDYRVHYAPI